MITKLEQLLREQNWGSYDFAIQQTESPALISAGIEDKDSWKVHIFVSGKLKELDQILSHYSPSGTGFFHRLRPKKENIFAGKENLDNIAYFIVGHEIGHWKYCPAHIDDREEIISGAAEGLRAAGFSDEEVEQYSQRVYNLFADVLDNVMNMYRDREKEKFQDGFLAFYAKEGIREGGYDEEFYLFVDTTCRLGTNQPEGKNFAAPFVKKPKELSRVTRQIITSLIEDETLAGKVMEEELALEEKVKIYQALDDRDKWHQKAREFAKLIGEYIRKPKKYQNQLSNEGGSGQPEKQDKKGNGRPGKKSQPGGGSGEEEKKMREMIRKSLKKGHSIAYAPRIIALDEIYRQRAEKIVIDIQKEEGEALRLAIGYMQRKEMDENHPDLDRIDWQNPELGMDEKGREELQFFERQTPFFADRRGSEKGGRVPDILFVVDKSGSVTAGYDPVQGTGPYDMVQRSIYSVFKQLEDNDLIQHMRFGIVVFEEKPNYFSGWHSYFNLDEVKKPLLNPAEYGPSGRSTVLDSAVIQEAVDTNPGKFWAIVVSDGGIFNLEEACQAVSYLAQKGNQISFIDVGGVGDGSILSDELKKMMAAMGYQQNQAFARHVQKVGGTVHSGSRPEDLPRMMLGKAQEMYEWK